MSVEQKDFYTEEEFRNLVLLGVDTMMPNSQSRIDLHGFEIPHKAAGTLVNLGIAGLNLDQLDEASIRLRYSPKLGKFNVDKLILPNQDGTRYSLTRNRHGYGSSITAPGKKSIEPRTKLYDGNAIDKVMFDVDIPGLYTQITDPIEYQNWKFKLYDRSKAWHTSDRQTIIKKRTGQIAAQLVSISEFSMYPGNDFVKNEGVEYRITDKTDSRVTSIETSYVGEQTVPGHTDFSSYDESRKFYPRTGQTERSERREVILTPLMRSVWTERLLEDDGEIPRAA